MCVFVSHAWLESPIQIIYQRINNWFNIALCCTRAYSQKEISSDKLEKLSLFCARTLAVYLVFSSSSVNTMCSVPMPEYRNGPLVGDVVIVLSCTE